MIYEAWCDPSTCDSIHGEGGDVRLLQMKWREEFNIK